MSKVPEFKSPKIVYQEAADRVERSLLNVGRGNLTYEELCAHEESLIIPLKSMPLNDVLYYSSKCFSYQMYPITLALNHNFVHMVKHIIDIARDSDYFEKKIFGSPKRDIFEFSSTLSKSDGFCLLIKELKPKLTRNILNTIYKRDLLDLLKLYVEDEGVNLFDKKYNSSLVTFFYSKSIMISKYLINMNIFDLNKEYNISGTKMSVLAKYSCCANKKMVQYILSDERLDIKLHLNGYRSLEMCINKFGSSLLARINNKYIDIVCLLLRRGAKFISDDGQLLRALCSHCKRHEEFIHSIVHNILNDDYITDFEVVVSSMYLLNVMFILLTTGSLSIVKGLVESLSNMDHLRDRNIYIRKSITRAVHHTLLTNSDAYEVILYILSSEYIDVHEKNKANDNLLSSICDKTHSKDVFNALMGGLDGINLALVLNDVNIYGLTPLHMACKAGNDVVVNEMMKYSQYIDINTKCKLGFTALDLSLMNKSTSMFKSIMKAFPDILSPLVVGPEKIAQKIYLYAPEINRSELRTFLYSELREYEAPKDVSNNIN